MTNIITAIFLSGRICKTPHAYQYDYGQRLVLKNLNLPAAYEVHFSNNEFGESKTAIGDADGVVIPDEYFLSGQDIHFWLFLHETESDGETEYHGIIPVRKRAKPIDTEPTPVQQDVIAQTIAALNAGVSRAEEAQAAWENMTAEAETLPEGSSASASYSNGMLSLGIPVGATGAPGRNGQDGQPGRDGQDGAPGQDGQDGVSPTITITDITGGHRISITAANGTKTFDVMDGATGPIGPQGEPGQDAVVDPTLTQTGQAADAKATGDEISSVKNALNQKIDDVQVNGTSIVENGVANVPVAVDRGATGVVKINRSFGITENAGILMLMETSIAEAKTGLSQFRAILPRIQHASTFYGLAKAAGDATQSASSNPVGTYTESAKSAISEMLNGSVSVSGTTPTINALPGIRYVCGEVSTLDFTPSASGICDVVFTSGSTPTVVTLPSTVKFPDGELTIEADTTYEINILDGIYGAVMAWT